MKSFSSLLCFSLISLFAPLHGGLLIQEAYHGPTEQLLKRDGRAFVEKKLLEMGIVKTLFPFFDVIAENEEWGHIGYHTASQEFRIYQDIIHLTIEEILHLPVRENFYFLRIPGDADLFLENIQDFFDFWGFHINNKIEMRQKQLLSLNYGIYSNYNTVKSSSALLFVEGSGNKNFEKLLIPFYQEQGLPVKALRDLFAIAKKHLNRKEGILLRLYENPALRANDQEVYNFADIVCYPCKGRGFRWGSGLISQEYQDMMTEEYVLKKIDISPQLRLLISNKNTLNPNSLLNIQRFDLYERPLLDAYEKEMRAYIKKLSGDPVKVDLYRKNLLKLWDNP